MTEEVTVVKKRNWLRLGLRLLLLFLLLLLLCVIALQFSSVQNYVAHRVTDQLSRKLDSDVSISKVNVSLSKGVQLEDFLIQSTDGDTILRTESLALALDQSLYSLVNSELDLSSIKLTGAALNIVTLQGEQQSNIQQLLSKLSSGQKQKTKEGKPTAIDLQELDITRFALDIKNENSNTHQQISVGQLYINIDSLMLDGVVSLHELKVDKPVVRIRKLGEKYELTSESTAVVTAADSMKADENLIIKVHKLVVGDGVFSYDDDTKAPSAIATALDYSHFEITDIALAAADLVLGAEQGMSVSLQDFSFVDDKGFQVKELTADQLKASDTGISLANFTFITGDTRLQRDIALTYDGLESLSDFTRRVYIKANFTNSEIYFGDLMHFVGGLHESKFFIENEDRHIRLSGKFAGPVDRLSGENMELGVDDKLELKANFSGRNLTRKDRELINLGVKELKTDMVFLRDFIPGFAPPDNFYKLGTIDFRGRFDGYLKDFVAYGSLETLLGDAFLDMRLDVKNGVETANYSGELSLEDFDLRTWSDNADLGMVNFSASIDDGTGLTLNSVDTELNAVVESITYKEYVYRDFVMDGQLSKNQFNGEFSITDENIDLIFDGDLRLEDKVPIVDFKANVERLDLMKLNLSQEPFVIRGNMDVTGRGSNINDIQGKAVASDLYIATNDTIYALDTMSLQSDIGATTSSLIFYSDIASVMLAGKYDLNTVVPAFKQMVKQSYPHYTQNWKFDTSQKTGEQDVQFEFDMSDTRNFLELAGVKNVRIRDFQGSGSMDTRANELKVKGGVSQIQIAGNSINRSNISMKSVDNKGDLYLTADSINWSGRAFDPVVLSSSMHGDTVDVFVGTTGISNSLRRLEVQAQLVPHEKGYAIQLADRAIEMLGKTWTFRKDNELIIGEQYLDIDNLRLTDGSREIIVDDIDKKGISLLLVDFDFKTVNSVINYDKMDFAGQGDLSVYVDDLFTKDKTYEANAYVNDFTINEDSFGTLELDVAKPYGQAVAVSFGLGTDSTGLTVLGTLDPDNNNYIDVEVASEDFDLGIFEYILKDGISNVYGEVDLLGTVRGPADKLKIDATAMLNNSGLKILYTGASYTFDQQKIICTDKIIDFTGATLVDTEGNEGVITGGIYHDVFTNFGVDANLSGSNVIAIDTKKGDNELYYGFAKGDVSVDFLGPFNQLDMNVICTTGPGTVINIPISDGTTATEKNFIEFIDSEELFSDKETVEKEFKIEGMDIEVDLTMTEAAIVNLIFDESKGDIITGTGRGALKMYITRFGDFDIYGDYSIEEGEYLFTAWGIVAKPFEVRRGSTIRWTGDPVNAELAIKADYSVRSPLSVFLGEYLINGTQAAAEANTRTQVDLILNLGGTLYKPSVSFDLDFPNVNGELASVTANKMRALRSNQSDLNNQVLGLIIFNTFLPSNSAGNTAGADIGAAGVSTLSEFLGSQLSILFTGLINDALADDGLISGVDFEIGLNKNSVNGVNQTSNDVLPDEIEVNLKNKFRFLDERLSLGLGGNYVRQSVLRTNNNYFVGDFVIEYFLTNSRKLKLQVYGKYDYDENLLGRRQKYGVGIGYRTEFGSLTEFKDGLSEQIKEDVKPGQ